jgi:hypothetical protein
VSNASIDLGAGNDVLTFGAFANSATVANTETINPSKPEAFRAEMPGSSQLLSQPRNC